MEEGLPLDSLAGSVAIVTGAASGIGLATARQLIREGVRVAAVDRDAATLAAAAATMDRESFLPIPTDVGNEESVDTAVSAVARAFGEVATILVQSAGIYRIGDLLETSLDAWNDVIGTNLGGTFLVGRSFVRALKAGGRGGVIVNVSSVAAYRGEAFEPKSAYAASKAGVLALTAQMAVEWGPLGVRVNVVVPGPTATPMLRILDIPDARGAAFLAGLPLGRVGTPEETANVICFLASPKASFMTGATVAVDGGLLAAHSSVPRPPPGEAAQLALNFPRG